MTYTSIIINVLTLDKLDDQTLYKLTLHVIFSSFYHFINIIQSSSEKLYLWKIQNSSWRSFLQSMSEDMDWLSYRWVEHICIFNKNRVSLYTRACHLCHIFSTQSFNFLFDKIFIIISFLLCRSCLSTFVD